MRTSRAAPHTHNFIAAQFDNHILHACIQQGNGFEFNFYVEVFVAEVCDEGGQNSAMKSTKRQLKVSAVHTLQESLLCEKQIIKQKRIRVVQVVHFKSDLDTVELKVFLNGFPVFASSRFY